MVVEFVEFVEFGCDCSFVVMFDVFCVCFGVECTCRFSWLSLL